MKGRGKRNSDREQRALREDKPCFHLPESSTPIDRDIDEVYIYSSSHFSEKRGLRGQLENMVGKKVHITYKVNPGKKFDGGIAKGFKTCQGDGKLTQKLHVIMIGDNDVRFLASMPNLGSNPDGTFKNGTEEITHFGETVKNLAKLPSFKGDTVFVNAVLPFPILECENFQNLIEKFYLITRSLSDLILFDYSINFIPMRGPALSFCSKQNMILDELFLSDKTHLSKKGEMFLAEHLSNQIKSFQSLKRSKISLSTFDFYRNVVNLGIEDEIERYFMISRETNFFEHDSELKIVGCHKKKSRAPFQKTKKLTLEELKKLNDKSLDKTLEQNLNPNI